MLVANRRSVYTLKKKRRRFWRRFVYRENPLSELLAALERLLLAGDGQFVGLFLRRLGLPAEVAKAIYYLCTDQSSYVTGAELMINGGQHV